MQKKLNFAEIYFISLAINVKETASAYIAFLLFSSPNIDWKECCLSYVLHSYSNVEGSTTSKCVFSLQQQDGPNFVITTYIRKAQDNKRAQSNTIKTVCSFYCQRPLRMPGLQLCQRKSPLLPYHNSSFFKLE